MTKKKSRRRPPPRPASTRLGSATGLTGSAESVERTTETSEARAAQAQNRLARKDEARRLREKMRKREARARFLKRAAIVGVAIVALAAVVFVLSRPRGLNARERELVDMEPEAAVAASCSDATTVEPYPDSAQDSGHPEVFPPLSSYSSQPPASGPHNGGSTTPAGVYSTPPDVYSAIHSLEHGAVIVWYRPDAANVPELTEIQEFFRLPEEQDHVIVAPYDYPNEGEAGALPEGQQMAVVSWHRMRTCGQLSLPVAFKFVHDFVNGSEAPEAGAPI